MIKKGFLLLVLTVSICGCTLMGVKHKPTKSVGHDTASPAKAHIDLAKLYLQRNQIGYALEKAAMAVELDPTSAEANVVLGLAYQRARETNKAAKYYVKAKGLLPNDPYVANAYGAYLCENSLFGEADREFLIAAQSPLNQMPWIAYTNAAICFERSGQRHKARKRLQMALAKNPNFQPALQAMKRVGSRL